MPETPQQNHPSKRALCDYDTPESILSVLHEAREALLALFVATGVDTSQTRGTARTLGLDRTFIWRLARVFHSEDLLTAVREFPDRNRIERICAACRDHGATVAQVERLQNGAARLEELIRTSAGDREAFLVMLSGLEYDDVTRRQEDARKQAFLGNSAVWGVQARVLLKTLVVSCNGEVPDRLDICRVAGMIDFRRLRDTSWPLYRSVAFNDDGTPIPSLAEAVDRDAEKRHGLPLLAAFSTDPLPRITRTRTSYGERFDLETGAIGKASSVDCIFADSMSQVSQRFRDQNNLYGSSMIDITTPAEVVISDLFVQRDLGFKCEPEALLVDRVNAPRGYLPTMDDSNRLPLSSRPLLMGPGAGGIATPYIPRYAALMRYVFARLGVDHEDFIGHRFVLRYPPLSTAVIVRTQLPESPSTTR